MKKKVEADLFSYAETAARVARRHEGMKRAVDHADAITTKWGAQAYEFIVAFAKQHAEFICEDYVKAYAEAGLPLPPNNAAWGAPTLKAVRAGILVKAGYRDVKTRNMSPKPLWRSQIFKRSDEHA